MSAKEIVVFGEREYGDTDEDNDEGTVSCNAGMQRNATDFLVLEVEDVAEFCNCQESKAACEHEDAGGDVHDWVVLESFERVWKQRKTYAAERTDGLEERTEDAVVEFHRTELREIGDTPDEF